MNQPPSTAIRNYIRLASFMPFRRYYAILDVPDYYADALFIRHEVDVRFGWEYTHNDSPYIVVFCKIRKKHERRFLDALAELPNKMLLCGHTDYPDFCAEFIGSMERGRGALKRGRGEA